MAVKRYQFVSAYRSDVGTWEPGQIVEFDEDFAAWLNRDVAGCLVPYEEPKAKAEARDVEKPASDRMQAAPERKRGG